MLKDAGAGLCKRCFYVKRGSLQNMKISDLITNINENEGFNDKSGPCSQRVLAIVVFRQAKRPNTLRKKRPVSSRGIAHTQTHQGSEL